jgi:hypothetical protein
VGIDDFLRREVTKFEAAEKGEVTVLMFERAVGMEHRRLWFAARVDEEGFGEEGIGEEGIGEEGIENGRLHADHARSGGRAPSWDAQELATGEEAGGSTKGEDRARLDESPSLQD